MIYAIIAAAVLLIAILVVSWLLSGIVVRPKMRDGDTCYRDEVGLGKIIPERYHGEYAPEDFTFTSPYGYKLSCTLIPRREDMPPADGRERVVIIVHGYTFCKFGSVKYIDIFRDVGFNCLIYDHRNHGYSDKLPTTMGYYESRDLLALENEMLRRFGDNAVIGTHGESMGAATVMMNAPMFDKLAFAIEDCGYSVLKDELAHGMKTMFHLPRYPFLPIASLISKLRGGVFFGKVVPMNEVKKCAHLPMMFIHGEADDFVPSYMVNEVYGAKEGVKRKLTFPGAAHAQSYWENRGAYTDAVREFLRNNGII